jgi:hypothetical protein
MLETLELRILRFSLVALLEGINVVGLCEDVDARNREDCDG